MGENGNQTNGAENDQGDPLEKREQTLIDIGLGLAGDFFPVPAKQMGHHARGEDKTHQEVSQIKALVQPDVVLVGQEIDPAQDRVKSQEQGQEPERKPGSD